MELLNDVKWNYYLVEILNPDLAISTFYINIVQKPFITTTIVENNICKLNVYLKILDDTNMKITIKHHPFYEGLIDKCPVSKLDYIQKLVSTFFIGKVHNYITNYSGFNNIIYD